jgi:signal transduction histidine kinase
VRPTSRHRTITRDKLIKAAKKIILVEETEKANLGRELHDITGHKLMNITSFMEAASYKYPEEKKAGIGMVTDLQEQMRRLSHRFNQHWLERFSFNRNIEGLCREAIKLHQLNLSYTQPEEYPDLPAETRIHLYRIVQEMITNAAKYAKTARIHLEIAIEHNCILLHYMDDGPGFDRDEKEDQGIGIIHINERARLMHGAAILDTRPGFGVSWELSIPLPVSGTPAGKPPKGKS